MPYDTKTPHSPLMMWKISYNHHLKDGPEVFIIRWDKINAISRIKDSGSWGIKIHYADSWIQFEENSTPDALAFLQRFCEHVGSFFCLYVGQLVVFLCFS